MLDLIRLYGRVERMVERRRDAFPALRERAKTAGAALASAAAGDLAALRDRLQVAKTPWLVACPLEPVDTVVPWPERLEEYAALSADGSQIAPDRHGPVLCYVLNIATVYIRYGERAEFRSDAEPLLFFEEEDLFGEVDGTRVRVQDEDLAAHRTRQEFAALEALIDATAGDGVPAVAFVDGTLILWALWNARSEAARRAGLAALARLLDRARHRGLPVAGYISDPGSSEAANIARVLLCPLDVPDCRHCRYLQEEGRAPCQAAEGINDGILFQHLLEREGERSSVFESRSRILAEYAPEHRTCFFYVRTGAEIARLEVPRWVAGDPALLDRVHTAACDQAAKGQGYPVIIDEAHKQAVVTGADRQAFNELVERVMANRGVRAELSAKSLAKRGGVL